jgi:hypothetical protein
LYLKNIWLTKVKNKSNLIESNKIQKIDNKVYVTGYEQLRRYAIKYINRYFPSVKQTEQKLMERTSNNIFLTRKVLTSVQHLIEEDKMINNFVSQLRHRWKSNNYILEKLKTKQYSEYLINSALSITKLWKFKEYSLEDKVKYYKKRGKNRNEVKNMFLKRNINDNNLELALNKVFVL